MATKTLSPAMTKALDQIPAGATVTASGGIKMGEVVTVNGEAVGIRASTIHALADRKHLENTKSYYGISQWRYSYRRPMFAK